MLMLYHCCTACYIAYCMDMSVAYRMTAIVNAVMVVNPCHAAALHFALGIDRRRLYPVMPAAMTVSVRHDNHRRLQRGKYDQCSQNCFFHTHTSCFLSLHYLPPV